MLIQTYGLDCVPAQLIQTKHLLVSCFARGTGCSADPVSVTATRLDLVARVERAFTGVLTLEWCTEDDVSLNRTHVFKSVVDASSLLALENMGLVVDDVLCRAGLTRMLSIYSVWRSSQLRQIAAVHNIRTSKRDNHATLRQRLLSHDCDHSCECYVVVFTTLSKLRTLGQIDSATDAQLSPMQSNSGPSYLQVADDSLRKSIIEEWQATMSTSELEQVVCAPCGRRCLRRETVQIQPTEFDLTLLRNDSLPPRTLPTNYSFQLYQRALLELRAISLY